MTDNDLIFVIFAACRKKICGTCNKIILQRSFKTVYDYWSKQYL